MKQQQHLFTNKMLRALLVPIIMEQLLNALMGTVDTMMVSNVGSAAISAVSLVDSINVLIIQAFSALAAGGTIICTQYLGQKNHEMANKSARQALFIITAISVFIVVLGLAFRAPLLSFIFGKVDADVMENSMVYFFYTVLSYPFIALYDAGASIFRAQENTRGPMVISIISNVMNIVGNGILIWVFHMGVAGAAISTLVSRIFCAVVVLYQLRKDRQPIVVRDYLKIRPDGKMIGRILALGIPSGIENSMFQLGKLAIQSTVSTLGTTAIAAQAMTNMLEMLNGTAVIGVGIGLMTVVGQSLGAGRKDEAVYYMKKLMIFSEVFLIACCAVVYVLARPITMIGGMEAKSAEMCLDMMFWITIVKPIVWMFAFIPAYGMRAAGDVNYPFYVGLVVMWSVAVGLGYLFGIPFGWGICGMWVAFLLDENIRGAIFVRRWYSMKWVSKSFIK